MTDHKTANMSTQETIAVELGRPATYQDVLDAPEHLVAEIIDSTLYLSPRPPPLQALTNFTLNGKISAAYDPGQGRSGNLESLRDWWVLREPEIHLGDKVIVPDLVGWRHSTMPEYPYDAPYFTVAPDWVCEILSTPTHESDLDWKRPFYAHEGVSHLWLANPIDRTLEAFELKGGEWVPIASLKGDDSVSVPPFDAITFHLGDIWTPEASEKPLQASPDGTFG